MQKHNRIVMLIAGVIMLFFLGIIYAWSIFKVPIQATFPDFTAAQLSMNFTLTMIGFCIGGFLGGKIAAGKSPAAAVRISGILLFAGFFITSLIAGLPSQTALLVMYISYGLLSGIGTGIGYNACLGNIAPFFPECIALISGILLMGFGLGSLFIGIVVNKLVASTSIFGIIRILGIIVLAVTMAGSFFIKRPDVPKRSAQENPAANAGGATPAQMIRTPFFWLFFIWSIMMSSSGMLVINSAANIVVYYGAAAGIGMGVSLFNGCGRPVIGALMDRLGQTKGMLCVNLILLCAGLLLLFGGKGGLIPVICAGMFMVGVCYGGGMTITTKVISSRFGQAHYAENLGVANFCIIPASLIGPFLSGILLDRSGGDFFPTFVLLTSMSLINLLILFLLNTISKKR